MFSYRVYLALGAVVLSSGFAQQRPARGALDCPPPNADVRGVNLRGRWIVEVTADSGPTVRRRRALVGSMELTTRDTTLGFVYTGMYAANFRAIGLYKRSGEVLVSVPPGDTIRIILDPTVDHGNLELVGRCRSGRLVGTWLRTGEPGRAWGHFLLRRPKE